MKDSQTMRVSHFGILILMVAASVKADDGAVSIAAGGLVFKHETGISMAKEVLNISPSKVSVDYEFRNNTDDDIVTEIAFPVPPYKCGDDELEPKVKGFDDFHLTVEGKPVAFQTEVKARLRGRDVTALLVRHHLDVATFGHADENGVMPDIRALSGNERGDLVQKGVLKKLSGSGIQTEVFPAWSVDKKYYWLQTFPAHSAIHIHHSYSPVQGAAQIPSDYIGLSKGRLDKQHTPYGLDPASQHYLHQTVASFCLSTKQEQRMRDEQKMYFFNWVDFILTTANTWRQPIEDFTLNVEKSSAKDTVSFCWDGPVERIDAMHFRAHAINFVPREELRVGFY